MSDLAGRLERLGLSQYLEVFVAEGFDTWETVLDITESDLNALNVKLGHRRKLQRAIAETRGQSNDRPLPIALGATTSTDYRSDDSAPESKGRQGDGSTALGTAGTSTKRKYRRHPKPDENAPERPPSAYVIFSNQVRESLKGQELSFTEIAKIVGERWQVLPTDAREGCERQANTAKEKYYAEMAEYKKTPQYDAYQKYLEEFKAKHAAQHKEGKRPKPSLETETSTSTRSSAHEQPEHHRRVSTATAQSDPYFMAHNRSESSPPLPPTRLPTGHSYGSKSTSPAMHSHSALNSPRSHDLYSPMSISPRSATIQKDVSSELHYNTVAREARERYPDLNGPFQPPPYTQSNSISSTTPPLAMYGTHYQPSAELPSRRPVWESTRLPPLSHEDTTLSSESGGGYGSSVSFPPHTLPIADSSKSMRVLPQPVPTIGATPSPLDRFPPSSQSSQDFRAASSLAALLRAGELASRADEDVVDKNSAP